MNVLTIHEAHELAEQVVGFDLESEYVERGDNEGVKFYVDSIHPNPPAMEIYFEDASVLIAERKLVKVAEGMVDSMKRDGIYEDYK